MCRGHDAPRRCPAKRACASPPAPRNARSPAARTALPRWAWGPPAPGPRPGSGPGSARPLIRPPSCCASRHLLRIAPPQCASLASLRRATPLASPVRLVYAPIIGHHTSDLWGGVAVVPRSADLDLPVPGGAPRDRINPPKRSEEHTSELQSRGHLVCRLLLEKKKSIYAARRCFPSASACKSIVRAGST